MPRKAFLKLRACFCKKIFIYVVYSAKIHKFAQQLQTTAYKMTNKEKYSQLCTENDTIPLFLQHWWMEAVCTKASKEWDVLLYEKNKKVVAALPYHFITKLGMKVILQPQLTQYSGVWIDYPNGITDKERYSLEEEVCKGLISQLDTLSWVHYMQHFHYRFTNWLPFFQQGFTQTTRYTYRIESISNTQDVFDNFHQGKQKHIKKAKDLSVDYSLSAADFYAFLSHTIAQKQQQVVYSQSFFVDLHQQAVEREQGQIIAVRDKTGAIHAAMFVVWDHLSGYYLVSAIDANYKHSGASSLMLWEAICFLSSRTKSFDFEGSMIKGVAKANQEFGGVQTPYFSISKSRSGVLGCMLNVYRWLWKK